MSQTGPPSPRASLEDADTPPHRRRARRILPWALAVSALVHLLLIAVYPLLMERFRPGDAAQLPSGPEPAAGIRVVQIDEVATEPSEEPIEEPDEPEEVVEPAPRPTPARPGRAREAEPSVETGASAAERLRPGQENVKLWAPVDPTLTELTDEERARLGWEARMRAWNDSMAAADERARAATDWTYTDDDGKRWGVSPGKIHLGSITLPLPIQFATPPGRRDDAERRAWEWAEIQRGAAQADVWRTWKERADQIRARKDRERADTTGAAR